MTPPELRICLVGFGSIARTHASALAALPSVRALPFRPVLAATLFFSIFFRRFANLVAGWRTMPRPF